MRAEANDGLVIIRWNPDEYTTQGSLQEMSEYKRLSALKRTLQCAVQQMPGQLLSVQYLFYDDTREAAYHKSLATALNLYVNAGS